MVELFKSLDDEFICMVECKLHMHVSDVIVQNFETKFLLRRGEWKT